VKENILIGLIFFFVCITNAQKIEFENITKLELEEKIHPVDSSAPAAILFKKARTTFKYNVKEGFVSFTEVVVKIKIYKKEGLNWANFEIPYYVGYEYLNDESVVVSKAFTYNLENGKIVKEKVNGEGKFNEDINEFWKSKSVVFPNVKIGSIIELKYVLKSQNLSVLPDFQFQYTIPVNYAEYVTEIPEFYIYKSIKNGLVDIDVKESLENSSFMHEDKFVVFFKQIKSKYIAKNVPSMVKESFVNNINNYFGKIELELQTIRMPNESPKQLITTWEDVVKSIYEEKKFGEELVKMGYFFNELQLLIKKTDSDNEKISKVFEFVKNRMTWNGRYSYTANKGVEKAYRERVGNSAEINLILVAMLKMAGLESNPVIISTRGNGIALFPNKSRFNHVIASVKIGNNISLLDASNKWSNIDILPIEDLNWTGRLIEKDGTNVEIDLVPKMISKDYVSLMAVINQNGEVTGKAKEHYFDHYACNFRNKYANISKERYLETHDKKHNRIEISQYNGENNRVALDKPVIESFTFKHNNIVEVIGDRMYFLPLLYFANTENPFTRESRLYPIDFSYPMQKKYIISITIPEGYVVESLPTPVNLSFSENLINFKYSISNNGQQIQVSSILDINTSVISSENYNELKTLFREMIKKQTEKVVLKKA